ncbi:MAG: hypothetical protein HOO97_09355 [Sideroxydans sp.]|nr:hypothetical protein [Sideroxydans sp.]
MSKISDALNKMQKLSLTDTVSLIALLVAINKLRDSLASDEWLDMALDVLWWSIIARIAMWAWFGKTQREQAAKTAESLEVVSGSDTSIASQNNPRSL